MAMSLGFQADVLGSLRPLGDLPFSVPNPISVVFRNDHLVHL